MENETGLWIIGVLVAILAIVNIFGFMAISNQEVDVNVDLSEQNTVLKELTNAVDNLAIEEEVSEDVSEVPYMYSKSEYEDEVSEAKALEMALAELDSRDFKKAVFDALELALVDVESYKDITEIKVMDSDVDGEEVTLDVKIYYFLDGDEEETEKARLNEFTITIDDLDFDDEFEDAEVNEDYLDTLEVMKVYN